jgi:hypothetical protein
MHRQQCVFNVSSLCVAAFKILRNAEGAPSVIIAIFTLKPIAVSAGRSGSIIMFGTVSDLMRSALLWDMMQRRVVIFLPTFRDNVSVPTTRVKSRTLGSLNMGPIRCPETSAKNYPTTPRNIPEERRSNKFWSSYLLFYYRSLSFKIIGWQ